MNNVKIECQNCRLILEDTTKKCPNCGSNEKKYYKEIDVKCKVLVSIKGKCKDITGFIFRRFLSREKISGKTKKETREEYFIDKRHNKYYHNIEEKDEKGNFKICHHEEMTLDDHNNMKNK